jgi:hypothetical protein
MNGGSRSRGRTDRFKILAPRAIVTRAEACLRGKMGTGEWQSKGGRGLPLLNFEGIGTVWSSMRSFTTKEFALEIALDAYLRTGTGTGTGIHKIKCCNSLYSAASPLLEERSTQVAGKHTGKP